MRSDDGSLVLPPCIMCFFFALSVVLLLMGLLSPMPILGVKVPPRDEGSTSSVKCWDRSEKLTDFI